MRTILTVLSLTLLVACDDEYPPLDSGDPAAQCQLEDFQASRNAGMTISQLIYNGIPILAGFDPTAVYDSGPASCIRRDGRAAFWRFEAEDALWGELYVESATTGSFGLNETTATARITILGPPSTVITTGPDWQSGSWAVVSVDPISLDLDGYSDIGGGALQITLSAEASR